MFVSVSCKWYKLIADPRRSHPAQSGEGFDAPPTLERSGSEHRRAVTSPLSEEEGLGEKVELSLQERRRGRKNSFWLKGDGGFRKCIPSNHPITYHRYEKGNRHTARSIRNIPHDYWSNRTTHYHHDKQ